MYAVGGHDGPLIRSTVEVFNSQMNTWRPVATMNVCRRNAGVKLFCDFDYFSLNTELSLVMSLFCF